MRKFLVFAMIAVVVIVWLYVRQSRPVAFVVSGFVEADDVRVGSRVGGRVATVAVNEGDHVRTGATLFTLDVFDWQQRLAQAQAMLASASAEHARLSAGYRPEERAQARARRDRAAAALEKLNAGPRAREIEIARERVKVAEANLELAQSEFDRVKGLREEASAAKVEYDQAVREVKRSQAESAAARQELALLEEGTRIEELAEARAVLAEAEAGSKLIEAGFRAEDIARAAAQAEASRAEVAAIETQMKELSVVSPCECVVESIRLRPGDLVSANAPAVSLLDISRLWVRSYVPESLLGDVRLGQEVPVRVDGFPTRRFRGRVGFLASEGEFTPRNIQTPEERGKQVFRIKVTIEEGASDLRVGMGADVLFSEATHP
jgi:multidrug resistance efflux pump